MRVPGPGEEPVDSPWIIVADLLPREELDNAMHLLLRPRRVLWLNGTRKPGDHSFHDTVCIHHTVEGRMRAGDNGYTRKRGRRAAHNLTVPGGCDSMRCERLLTLVVTLSMAGAVVTAQESWSPLGPYGAEIRALTIDPSRSATIYAGTTGGLLRSLDSGATWSRLPLGGGPFEDIVRKVAVDPITPSILYAASDSGFFRSTNAGVSWQRTRVSFGLSSSTT